MLPEPLRERLQHEKNRLLSLDRIAVKVSENPVKVLYVSGKCSRGSRIFRCVTIQETECLQTTCI